MYSTIKATRNWPCLGSITCCSTSLKTWANFRLYSPLLDGPGELLRGQASAQPQLAFDNIYRVSPELARASLTFDLSEPVNRADVSSAALGTEMVMGRIEASPTRAVNTNYLDGWLLYGNRVSVEYSFNFVPSRSTFAILLGPDATSFLHYAVELDFTNFPVETDPKQTKFYTTIDVNLEIRDRAGNLVLADDKESYIELSRSQMESLERLCSPIRTGFRWYRAITTSASYCAIACSISTPWPRLT